MSVLTKFPFFPNSLVIKDINGDFTANIITATLNGKATTAESSIHSVNADTAINSISALGLLVQETPTTPAFIITSNDVYNDHLIINAATTTNVPDSLVLRDSNGDLNATSADNAIHSINADNAIHSINADNAIHSINADNAIHSINADNAIHSINANNAINLTIPATSSSPLITLSANDVYNNHLVLNAATTTSVANTLVLRDSNGNLNATSADNAIHSVNADNAIHSINADNAIHSINADNAIHSTNADNAIHSTSADTAIHSINADNLTIPATSSSPLITVSANDVYNNHLVLNAATTTSVANTLVLRDSNGNLNATSANNAIHSVNADNLTIPATSSSPLITLAASDIYNDHLLLSTATTISVANSIVLRDNTSNISANIFTGRFYGNILNVPIANNNYDVAVIPQPDVFTILPGSTCSAGRFQINNPTNNYIGIPKNMGYAIGSMYHPYFTQNSIIIWTPASLEANRLQKLYPFYTTTQITSTGESYIYFWGDNSDAWYISPILFPAIWNYHIIQSS
jgi:hypothetical protein